MTTGTKAWLIALTILFCIQNQGISASQTAIRHLSDDIAAFEANVLDEIKHRYIYTPPSVTEFDI